MWDRRYLIAWAGVWNLFPLIAWLLLVRWQGPSLLRYVVNESIASWIINIFSGLLVLWMLPFFIDPILGYVDELRSELVQVADRVNKIETLSSQEFEENLEARMKGNVPIRQVYFLEIIMSEHFWRNTVGVTDAEWAFLKGSDTGYVRINIEEWASHQVIQLRVGMSHFDTTVHYATDSHTPRIWEQPLSPKSNILDENLILDLEHGVIRLFADGGRYGYGPIEGFHFPKGEFTFLELPLHNVPRLENFAVPDDPEEYGWGRYVEKPWHVQYKNEDKNMGIEWSLEIRDLRKYAENA